jgi:hypothetical protein
MIVGKAYGEGELLIGRALSFDIIEASLFEHREVIDKILRLVLAPSI